MGRILSSRPGEEEELNIESFSLHELELIAALLWPCRLGQNVSPYRDAAFTLMTKIEDYMGDKFMEDSAIDVDMKIDIMDPNGNVERSVGYAFLEIDV